MNKVLLTALLSGLFAVSVKAQQTPRLVPTDAMALITFTVVNLDSIPQKDATVLYETPDKAIKGEGKVDANGQFKVLLPEGKKFKLSVKRGKVIDFGYLSVPSEKGPVRIAQVLRYDELAEKLDELMPESETLKATDELCLVKFKVTDYDSIPEQGAVVKYMLPDENFTGKGATDLDGNLFALLKEGKVYRLRVEKFGKTFDFGNLEIPAVKGPLHYTQLLRIRVITKYVKTYTLDNVYFDPDRATIASSSFATLNQLFEALKASPKQKIEIAGHTDSDGSEEANMRLSQARANAVKRFLENRGIKEDRIVAKGYGEKEPIADNNIPSGKKMNRRTEVRVIEE